MVSPLESLPRELRDIIYRYTVVEGTLVTAATLDTHTRLWRSNEPALARTNRLFRRESLPVYYQENIFTFPKAEYWPHIQRDQVESWLLAIGDSIELVKWVGAYHYMRDQNISVLATHTILSGSQLQANLQNPKDQWSRLCECDLDGNVCSRIMPVECEVDHQSRAWSRCELHTLGVCREIYEGVPLHRRLSFAMHFCHNYKAWRCPGQEGRCVACALPYELRRT